MKKIALSLFLILSLTTTPLQALSASTWWHLFGAATTLSFGGSTFIELKNGSGEYGNLKTYQTGNRLLIALYGSYSYYKLYQIFKQYKKEQNQISIHRK